MLARLAGTGARAAARTLRARAPPPQAHVRARRRSHVRVQSRAAPGGGPAQAPAVWDVVEYLEPAGGGPSSKRLRLGVVAGRFDEGATLLVEPLVADAPDDAAAAGDGGPWWRHDESAALDGPTAVRAGDVVRVVDADYSQVCGWRAAGVTLLLALSP
jgi:hypothetical protein